MATNATRSSTRRGSVLVLVVVLLVLVFLMGAAYLVTTRTDRYAAEQLRSNSQTDMVLEAVRSSVLAQVVADSPFYDSQLGTPTNVPAWDAATNNTNNRDLYLAERYPDWRIATEGAAPGAPHPYWSTISWPVAQTGGAYQFEDPFGVFPSPALFGGVPGRLALPAGTLKNAYRFRPTSRTVNGTVYPAMDIYSADFNGLYIVNFPAADADGDGIADSFLFRVPQMDGDGVTYYAAIRVVDNAAAINANTAWSRVWDFDTAGTAVPLEPATLGYFPASVGLVEMLRNLSGASWNTTLATFNLDNLTTANTTSGQSESRNLYNARAGLTLNNAAAPDIWGMPTGGTQRYPLRDGTPGTAPAESSTANGHPQYLFLSLGDALNSQLARRTANPGYAVGTTGAERRFSAFPETDTLSLASGFCIGSTSIAAPSVIEQTLPFSLFKDPLLATASWVKDSPYLPGDAALWYADNFDWGDAGNPRPLRSIRAFVTTSNPLAQRMVTHPVAGGMTNYPNTYVQPTAAVPGFPADRNPAKASVNNSDFATLWRAFWNAMCNTATYAADTAPTITGGAANRVLNSPVRDAGVTLTERQMMVLRSAIAAVNAEDLRGNLYAAPTARPIAIPQLDGGAAYDAVVYGTKAQPYITEVLYDNDGAGTEYLAIELYNPYPVALSVAGWRFATYNQAANALAFIPTPLAGTVPPMGYLTIVSDAVSPSTPTAVTVAGTPAVHSDITTAIETELVLLRPSSTASVLVHEMVPVDQVDLRGIRPTSGADRFNYQRLDALSYWAWPGITQTPAYPTPAMRGMIQAPSAPGSLGALNTETFTAGGAGLFAIPLAHADWPGPAKWGAVTPNVFPFGGFARDGDMLRIPFIGAYTIAPTGAPTTPHEFVSPTLDAVRVENNAIPVGTTAIGRFDRASYGDWTGQIFNHLTVDLPADDFMPALNVAGSLAVPNGPIVDPTKANQAAAAGDANERMVPVQGKININTIPWRIFAALPMLPPDATPGTANYRDTRARTIAEAIVADRRTAGQFATVADLNRVATFQTADGLLPAAPGVTWGHYSTYSLGFERENLMLSRISNLITTRSDSYTMYITIQAWSNGGQPTATMESERRYAYFVDRSGVTPSKPNPRVLPIPTR